MTDIKSRFEQFSRPEYYSRVDDLHVLDLHIGLDGVFNLADSFSQLFFLSLEGNIFRENSFPPKQLHAAVSATGIEDLQGLSSGLQAVQCRKEYPVPPEPRTAPLRPSARQFRPDPVPG